MTTASGDVPAGAATKPATLTVNVFEEPRWKWLAVPTALMAIGAACLFATLSTWSLSFLGAVLVGYFRAKAQETSSRQELEIASGELHLRGRPQLSGRRLLDVRRGADPEQLVLTGVDGTTVEVRARNEEEASSVLSALRRGTVVSGRVPGLRDLISLAVATLALSAGIVAVAPPILWWLAIAVPAAMAAWVRDSKQVIVGEDGIVIRSLRDGGRRRFVPYAEVVRISDDGVVTKDGKVISLAPDLATSAFDPAARASATEVIEAIRKRVARAQDVAQSAAPELEGALASADPSQEGGFRDASVPDEDLWQLLERHDTRLELRTRAAEVLRRRVAPDALRVRVAELARVSAREETREALFRIAAEEEAEEAEERSSEASRSRSE